MRHRAVAAQVAVPGVVLAVDAALDPFSMRWSKKARSSCLSFSSAAKVYFSSFLHCRIARQVGERDLRFDHPEFGEVAAGVRVLGPEGRAERINLG